jgi:hypothetical protein
MACRNANLESDYHKRSGISKVLLVLYSDFIFPFYLKIIQRKHFKNDLLLYAVHLFFAWHHKADKRNTFRKAHRFLAMILIGEYCSTVVYITSFQE